MVARERWTLLPVQQEQFTLKKCFTKRFSPWAFLNNSQRYSNILSKYSCFYPSPSLSPWLHLRSITSNGSLSSPFLPVITSEAAKGAIDGTVFNPLEGSHPAWAIWVLLCKAWPFGRRHGQSVHFLCWWWVICFYPAQESIRLKGRELGHT